MKMVRKQVYITEQQDEKLKRIAASQDATEAEVVRAALDALREVTYEQEEGSAGYIREAALKERYMAGEEHSIRQDAAGTLSGHWELDDRAWQEELAFMKSLAATNVGSNREASSWKFNREEVYEERLARVLRRQ